MEWGEGEGVGRKVERGKMWSGERGKMWSGERGKVWSGERGKVWGGRWRDMEEGRRDMEEMVGGYGWGRGCSGKRCEGCGGKT